MEPVFELICVCNCIDSPALLYVVMIFEKGYFEKICSLVFLMLGFYLLYLFIMIIDENKELSSFLGILLACIINVLTIYFALRTFDRFMINSNGEQIKIEKEFDADHKVLTITPKSALSASSVYILNLIGVSDKYNQELPLTVIKFTTAAA